MATIIATRRNLAPLKTAARIFRVPADWSKAEAEAKRIPCLVADDQMLFNVELVGKLLLERASVEEESQEQ